MATTTISYSYDYYLRSIYSSNRFARKSENRSTITNKELVQADSDAMKKITEKLRDLEYSSDNASEVLTDVKMFIETYNNLISSTEENSSDEVARLQKQITQLTKDHKDELESLGISINSSNKLTLDKSKFGECSPSKIKRFFGKDSDYISSIRNYSLRAKRLARRQVETAPEETSETKNKTTQAAESDLLQSLLAYPENGSTFDAKS
ncbi:MAG: hypothetical protein Q4D32_10175 [Eubacteriales bacterium]|nr:hypothetical protein [Eubacteriales bacterium]